MIAIGDSSRQLLFVVGTTGVRSGLTIGVLVDDISDAVLKRVLLSGSIS